MPGGVLRKIMPARTRAEDLGLIVDLDDLIAKPVGFRVFGKLYKIEPVTTEAFMRLADTLGEIQTLTGNISSGGSVSNEQVYEKYHNYISALCPTFELATLKKMSLPQVHGLLNVIIKQATGQPMNLDDQKKKMTG